MFYVVRWGDTVQQDVIVGEFATREDASVLWGELQDLYPNEVHVVRSEENHAILLSLEENEDIDFDDPYGGWEDDAYAAQWDDDPSPYGGTYSEE